MNLEGHHIGEFEILERIGQGGMGAVYKARQKSLRRTVALKTLQSSLADDVEYIARFEQEAVAAAALMHPNLVQVFSAGENEGLHWFAMEYVEGESANARLKRKGRLDPLEAIAIAIHVATALEYGWRKAALIHRDIKPDNIFLSSDGEVKLGDLGLAKSAGQTQGLTMTGAMMGTPHYISPEQLLAMKDVDLRADIYSLGCTLYHLLCGQPPYAGDSSAAVMLKHMSDPVPDLRSAWPACPAELAVVVGKMMQKRPTDRQQSYKEVNAELRHVYDLMSGTSVPDAVAVTQKPVAVEKKRAVPVKAWLVYGIAMIAAIAALIHFAPWKKTNPAPPRDALEPGAIKLWDSPEKLSGSQTARWEDGAMRLDGGSPTVEIEGRDGILRARIKRNKDAVATQISLRVQNGSHYRLTLQFTNAELFAITKGAPTLLAHWPLPREFAPDEWPLLEFKAVGDELSASIEGQPLGSLRDRSIEQAGSVTAFATRAGYFRDVIYVPLDKATASAAVSATKDAPFVNSLDMKFVPVPGTKVLFSVWDTRVQDYAAYAGAKEEDDSWTKQKRDGVPAGRELNHPVVGVSWEDAQGFCQWLTEKEMAERKLPKGLKYRLPTDEEWSWAVGLPPELGGTPAEKNGKNRVDFPWGKDYPPTKKVGNYGDETFHGKFPKEAGDKKKDQPWIEGYTDGYATTSPVGSFPVNAYGLYDMGGNVWQWCEDWYDASRKDRVLRGASWAYIDRSYLLSSYRDHRVPGNRDYNGGFRCVLAPSN